MSKEKWFWYVSNSYFWDQTKLNLKTIRDTEKSQGTTTLTIIIIIISDLLSWTLYYEERNCWNSAQT
jgi:hypothetical protein